MKFMNIIPSPCQIPTQLGPPWVKQLVPTAGRSVKGTYGVLGLSRVVICLHMPFFAHSARVP
jgi:hypothetical protein